jgi:hypothetical protein
VGSGSFSMRFHADGVKVISAAIAPAANRWSSPAAADVKIRGVCVFRYRTRNLRVPFEFYVRTPDVRVPEPSDA